MDIVKAGGNLPSSVDDLHKFLIVGKEQLNAHKAKIRAISKIDVAHGAKDAALSDAQSIADVLLDAESKLGEMLANIQPKREKEGSTQGTSLPSLPPKITKKESHHAQTISKNPDVVEKVKEDAREKGTIPTSQDVYKAVQKRKNKNIKKKREKEETQKNVSLIPTVLNCDCLKIIDEVDPVDLLITDPPYFTDGDFTDHISKCLNRVKPTGQAYVFTSADPNELSAYLSLNTHHMKLAQVLVWNYNNTGQKQPNVRYTSNYQMCFYYRGTDAPNINKPSDGKHQYACQTINAPDARRDDRYHKWQKPSELIERLIRNSSRPDDFVFDPFVGSGTTVVVAASLGLRAVGCDTDPEAIKICVERGCNEL